MNTSKIKKIKTPLICAVVLLLVFFLAIMKKKEPVIIGFSAQLTGRQAELGVQERNGVKLAVEEINNSGGIEGHKISLVINDDKGTPEGAQASDDKLIKDGAVAIIGHATTSQTLAGLEVTNPKKIAMIGPTISTPELSGIDDYFFRVHPSFKDGAQCFARHINKDDGINSIAVIYDKENLAYSETYSKIFTDEFEKLGGTITSEISFSSATQEDFSKLLLKLQQNNMQGLLIIGSDIDTALIAQRAKLMDSKIKLFGSDWAETQTLISDGGNAIEGIEFEEAYNLDSQTSNFIKFKSNYKSRFGVEPSFGASYGYESMLVLADALKRNNCNKDGLKQALLETHDFNGLMDTFSFDEFGDVQRPYYITKVRNGKINIVKQVDSAAYGGE